MKSTIQSVALVFALIAPAAALADDAGRRTLFIASAVEHPDTTATFPLHRGTSQGRTVFYILLDSSNDDDARALGINVSRKLANARGTTAVQKVRIVNGVVDFPATVDFRPARQVAPSFPGGFPPSVAEPGGPRSTPRQGRATTTAIPRALFSQPSSMGRPARTIRSGRA